MYDTNKPAYIANEFSIISLLFCVTLLGLDDAVFFARI